MNSMAATSTEYLLLVTDTTPEVYDRMTADERRTSLDRWNEWVDGMSDRGLLRAGQPLVAAARMVSGAGGRKVFDGPFTEAKELVGGYFILGGTTLDEVTEIARQCPNLQNGMTVEIRPIANACHLAESLGWETMKAPVSV